MFMIQTILSLWSTSFTWTIVPEFTYNVDTLITVEIREFENDSENEIDVPVELSSDVKPR